MFIRNFQFAWLYLSVVSYWKKSTDIKPSEHRKLWPSKSLIWLFNIWLIWSHSSPINLIWEIKIIFLSCLGRKTWISLHKKWSFPLRISSVNATKSARNCGFGHIYWRNPYWKTSFFMQCIRWMKYILNDEKLTQLKFSYLYF